MKHATLPLSVCAVYCDLLARKVRFEAEFKNSFCLFSPQMRGKVEWSGLTRENSGTSNAYHFLVACLSKNSGMT